MIHHVAQVWDAKVSYNDVTCEARIIRKEDEPHYASNVVDVLLFEDRDDVYDLLMEKVTKWKSGYLLNHTKSYVC